MDAYGGAVYMCLSMSGAGRPTWNQVYQKLRFENAFSTTDNSKMRRSSNEIKESYLLNCKNIIIDSTIYTKENLMKE